jgi:hypothetical protein
MAGRHGNTPISELASTVAFMHFRLGCWRSIGLTAANAARVPIRCVSMERWKASYMCLCSAKLRTAHRPSIQGRSMRIIKTEAPQLALASFLSEV